MQGKKERPLILCIGECVEQNEEKAKKGVSVIYVGNKREAEKLLKNVNSTVWLETKTGSVMLYHRDVLYAETDGRWLRIVTKNRVIEKVKMGIGEFVELINRPELCRCHKSFAVNTEHIVSLENVARRLWEAHMDIYGEHRCPVGNSYYEKIKSML